MSLRHRTVSQIMRSEFVSLERADRLDFAQQIMQLGRIRHLPVLSQGRVVGIVSNRDLLAASLSKVLQLAADQRHGFLGMVEVEEVMTKDVETVAPDTALEEAARLMLRKKIGCLIVASEDRVPLGLVTETDLLREAYLPGEDL
ncbi:MAG: CBS domain-containing protein [Deltaproteobacteria bacterium]|nr:CBS domain-containing protein [Deltaproteobacteria bacterium]